MKFYRIAKKEYLDDLSGEGARLYGGRWNKKGYSMLYFSESLSLALLEILVHLDFKYLTPDFGYIEVELPDTLIQPKVKVKNLDSSWRNNPPPLTTQNYGSKWMESQKNVALLVPSAILPQQCNILINPRHKNSSKLKIVKRGLLDVDVRIFKTH